MRIFSANKIIVAVRITSLRLIQPQIELRSAASAAMNFEQKAFKEAATKVCRDPVPPWLVITSKP